MLPVMTPVIVGVEGEEPLPSIHVGSLPAVASLRLV
jgi:hypothetical protein